MNITFVIGLVVCHGYVAKAIGACITTAADFHSIKSDVYARIYRSYSVIEYLTSSQTINNNRRLIKLVAQIVSEPH